MIEPGPRVDAAAGAGARTGDGTATFRVPDPEHQLAGLRLRLDVPGDALDFRRSGDGGELVIGRPPVSRMEYLVELRPPSGLTNGGPGDRISSDASPGIQAEVSRPARAAPRTA